MHILTSLNSQKCALFSPSVNSKLLVNILTSDCCVSMLGFIMFNGNAFKGDKIRGDKDHNPTTSG